MDMVFICRDALENSVIGNIMLGMEAKKAGNDVGIVFTEEALAALGGESFGWSPLLQGRDARIKISRNAKSMDIPVSDVRDDRWTDMSRMLRWAKEGGVKLWACPIWSRLLAVDGKLPPEVTVLDMAALLKELKEATTVIGGY